VTYALDADSRAIIVDWSIDKLQHDAAEAVFIAFPFNLAGKDFMLDLNGIPAVPNIDQLDGAAKDWYPAGRWVDVSDSTKGVTVVPLDAPLVHLGGITTGKWARTLNPESPTIMSWALNNHWLVNFRSSQSGRIPLRYRLTTHAGKVDPAAATRFAADMAVPPIALRDIAPTGARSASFLSLDTSAPVHLTTKPGEDDGWVTLRLQNLAPTAQIATVRFTVAPRAARAADPLEHPGDPLALAGGVLRVPLKGREIRTVLVRFAAQLQA
jgi:alpha-mannosidase